MDHKNSPPRLIVGIFDDENCLIHATESARQEGTEIHDVFTPYPVHGLEEAMGLRRTRLTYVCFFCGALGLFSALFFQIWCFTVNWRMNVGGKSFLALPALAPVTFEVGVLFAALGSVLALFIRAGLWPGKKPALAAEKVTDNQFALAVKASGNDEGLQQWMKDHGAIDVHEIEVLA